MDINGNDGPTIKKTFSCDGCKWISSEYAYKGHSCLHPDVISKTIFYVGIELNSDLSTPMFCPYILKKLRYEKLKEIK